MQNTPLPALPDVKENPAAVDSDGPVDTYDLPPVVRDAQSVSINGVVEEWRLEWAGTPKPFCVPPDATSFSCESIRYGERGFLNLVRMRSGQEIERLVLGDFDLRRWPAYPNDPFDISHATYEARPVVRILLFKDYDHDGAATEFALPVGGHADHDATAIVGISRSNPHLHRFGSAEHPDTALVFQHSSDVARLARSRDVDVVNFECGWYSYGLGDCVGDPREVPTGSGSCWHTNEAFHVHADGELHVKDTSQSCAPQKK